MAKLKKSERENIVERLRAIRGWATCLVPMPLDLTTLNPQCIINGVPAAPLQSIVGTCDDLLKLLIEPSSRSKVRRKHG